MKGWGVNKPPVPEGAGFQGWGRFWYVWQKGQWMSPGLGPSTAWDLVGD